MSRREGCARARRRRGAVSACTEMRGSGKSPRRIEAGVIVSGASEVDTGSVEGRFRVDLGTKKIEKGSVWDRFGTGLGPVFCHVPSARVCPSVGRAGSWAAEGGEGVQQNKKIATTADWAD